MRKGPHVTRGGLRGVGSHGGPVATDHQQLQSSNMASPPLPSSDSAPSQGHNKQSSTTRDTYHTVATKSGLFSENASDFFYDGGVANPQQPANQKQSGTGLDVAIVGGNFASGVEGIPLPISPLPERHPPNQSNPAQQNSANTTLAKSSPSDDDDESISGDSELYRSFAATAASLAYLRGGGPQRGGRGTRGGRGSNMNTVSNQQTTQHTGGGGGGLSSANNKDHSGDQNGKHHNHNHQNNASQQASPNHNAAVGSGDPRALMDRDSKRMTMGLMFPCVEVANGILLDRFVEFDINTVVVRSLVDAGTAGGVLTVITTGGGGVGGGYSSSCNGTTRVSVVHYEDCNFFHISVGGESKALISPTSIHLRALPDLSLGMPMPTIKPHSGGIVNVSQPTEDGVDQRQHQSQQREEENVRRRPIKSIDLYYERDDINVRIAALDPIHAAQLQLSTTDHQHPYGDIDRAEPTSVDGFAIPTSPPFSSLALSPRRAAFAALTNRGRSGALSPQTSAGLALLGQSPTFFPSLALLLQRSPLHSRLVTPTTPLSEVEARFAAMLSFALDVDFTAVPFLRSVVTLPLSTARYVSEMAAARKEALGSEGRSWQDNTALARTTDRVPIDFSKANRAEDAESSFLTITEGTAHDVAAASHRRPGDFLLGRSSAPPIQFAVDALCLLIRQRRPLGSVVAEARRLSVMIDAFELKGSLKNGGRIVPVVESLLEALLDENVQSEREVGGILATLVSKAIGKIVDARLEIIFSHRKRHLSVICVAILRGLAGNAIEEANLHLMGEVEKYARMKDGAVETVDTTYDAAQITDEGSPLQSETTFAEWLPSAFSTDYAFGRQRDGNRGLGTHAEAVGSQSAPVVLPSVTKLEFAYSHEKGLPLPGTLAPDGRSQQEILRSEAPFARRHQRLTTCLPTVIAKHRSHYLEVLLPWTPAEAAEQGGARGRNTPSLLPIYTCVVSVMSLLSDLDIVRSMQEEHFPYDCNENVAAMTSNLAEGVERADRNGYKGHSVAYTLVVCHMLRAVRSELAACFPPIPVACAEAADLTSLLLFDAKAMVGVKTREGNSLVQSLMRQPFVPDPRDRFRFSRVSPASQEEEENADEASKRKILSTVAKLLNMGEQRAEKGSNSAEESNGGAASGLAAMSRAARRVWPAVLAAMSLGSHVLNDCTPWTTPILAPFENLLFECLQQDLLEIIISGCHALWVLPPSVSGPLLCEAMPEFTSVLRRSAVSWFDLIGLGADAGEEGAAPVEAKSKLVRATAAVIIAKSIPRKGDPLQYANNTQRRTDRDYDQQNSREKTRKSGKLRGHSLKSESEASGNQPADGGLLLSPSTEVFSGADHLSRASIDWALRAVGVGGAIAEAAIVLEMHLFYCASIFWLEPSWWAKPFTCRTRRSGGSKRGVGDGGLHIFADTWSAIGAAFADVASLMPSPSPALLLWESVTKVAGAFAALQEHSSRPNERVFLSVRVYEILCRLRQQANMTVHQAADGVRYLTASGSAKQHPFTHSSAANAIVKSTVISRVSMSELPDLADGWESYEGYFHSSATVAVSRRASETLAAEEVLPCLVYIIDWIGYELLAGRPQSASSACSLLSQQLAFVGAPSVVTNALSQLAVAVLSGAGGLQAQRGLLIADNSPIEVRRHTDHSGRLMFSGSSPLFTEGEREVEEGAIIHILSAHFISSLYQRLDVSSACFSAPFMAKTSVGGSKDTSYMDGSKRWGEEEEEEDSKESTVVVNLVPYMATGDGDSIRMSGSAVRHEFSAGSLVDVQAHEWPEVRRSSRLATKSSNRNELLAASASVPEEVSIADVRRLRRSPSLSIRAAPTRSETSTSTSRSSARHRDSTNTHNNGSTHTHLQQALGSIPAKPMSVLDIVANAYRFS